MNILCDIVVHAYDKIKTKLISLNGHLNQYNIVKNNRKAF